MAETITTVITKIDNLGTSIIEPFKIKQYDTGSRFIAFEFQNEDGQVHDLTNHNVILSALKPDKKSIYNVVPIIDARNGIVKVELTTQFSAAVGIVECEINIYGWNETQRLSTLTFFVEVEKSLQNSDAVISMNEFNILERLMNQMWELWSFWYSIDDKIGFHINTDGDKTTLFKYLRGIYDFLVSFKANLDGWLLDFKTNLFNKIDTNQTILTNLLNYGHSLIGTSNDAANSGGGTLFSLLKFITYMFTSVWTPTRAAALDTIARISEQLEDAIGRGTSYTTPGTYTWIKPIGVNVVRAILIGGGGSGGNAPYAGAGGTGAAGGGSGVLQEVYVDVSNVSSVSVTVGSGGYNSAGGISSFGSYISSTGGGRGGDGFYQVSTEQLSSGGGSGGSGGGGVYSALNSTYVTYGAGGSGTSGTGEAGGRAYRENDFRYAPGSSISGGGGGGGGYFGLSSNGRSGTGYGAGGNGGSYSGIATTLTGGAGNPGFVFITW